MLHANHPPIATDELLAGEPRWVEPAHHPVRAWLVDLDGTLYAAAPVRLAMAGELLLGHWTALSVLRVFRQEQERLRGEIGPFDNPYRTQIQRTAERTHRSTETVEILVAEWMHRRPGRWLWSFRRRSLLTQIRDFRAHGGRTALVSDYPAAAKLTALRAADCFDVVVASGEWPGLTQLKPSPEGYLTAAAELGVAPAECLVLGDREDTDGEAARRAGIRFIQVGSKTSLRHSDFAFIQSAR